MLPYTIEVVAITLIVAVAVFVLVIIGYQVVGVANGPTLLVLHWVE